MQKPNGNNWFSAELEFPVGERPTFARVRPNAESPVWCLSRILHHGKPQCGLWNVWISFEEESKSDSGSVKASVFFPAITEPETLLMSGTEFVLLRGTTELGKGKLVAF